MIPDFVRKHLAARGDEDIVPTISLCKHWFNIWNSAEFESKLPRCTFIVMDDIDIPTYGHIDISSGSVAIITINNAYVTTRSEFVGTMLHELLHLEQWVNGEDVDHTDKFNTLAAMLGVQYGLDV